MNKNFKFRIVLYDNDGNREFECRGDNLYKLLLKFYTWDNSTRPTIWVYDEKTDWYIRVHDFQFGELNEETFGKYLNERIIDGDDLLENVKVNVEFEETKYEKFKTNCGIPKDTSDDICERLMAEKEEYNLSDLDFKKVIQAFYLSFTDRDNVIDDMYKSLYSLGRQYVRNMYGTNLPDDYIDYVKFAEDKMENDGDFYVILDDGRVVVLSI